MNRNIQLMLIFLTLSFAGTTSCGAPSKVYRNLKQAVTHPASTTVQGAAIVTLFARNIQMTDLWRFARNPEVNAEHRVATVILLMAGAGTGCYLMGNGLYGLWQHVRAFFKRADSL